LINLATDIIVDTNDLIDAIKSDKIIGYSVEPGRAITDKLKKYPQVHISPCSYDSDESRKNVKSTWINNMITAIKGHPENVWAGSIK
jgi:lactate dehydrogenase-like 2-hydroxyacid dehydrogenase